MITCWDEDYKKTKLLKRGVGRIRAPFDELATWIAESYGVPVLNLVYKSSTPVGKPSLKLILEHEQEAAQFRKGLTVDPHKRSAIEGKLSEIQTRTGCKDIRSHGLLVVASAFAPLALEEADECIQESEIDALLGTIDNPDIWQISRNFGVATFFFYTSKQVRQYERMGKRREYSDLYSELVATYDEFGYLRRSEYEVKFDSKENFDKNYQGNWFYYYR